MNPGQYMLLLKQSPLVVFGICIGIILATLIGQYQGAFEYQWGQDDGHIKIVSHPRCQESKNSP